MTDSTLISSSTLRLDGRRRPHGLAFGALCLAAALSPLQGAIAQSASSAVLASEARPVQVPAGPLAPALNHYAQSVDVALSFDAALLDGLKTGGLEGVFTVQEGFSRLLAGSGFQAINTAGRRYVLQTVVTTAPSALAAGSDDAMLSAIRVEGGGPVVEGAAPNSNYTVRSTASATQLDLAPKELPQSITTFTAQQIQDQGLLTVSEVLEHTPGVTLVTAGVAGAGSQPVYSRTLPVKAITMDGMMASTYILSGMREGQIGMQDSFLYERVDVLRGSTSLTGGRGDPSASLNFVRKHPYLDRHFSGAVKYGSWNTKRAEVDFSTPLTEDGRWRARIAAAMQKGDHWVDRVKKDTKALSLTTALDLTDNSTVSLGMTYYNFDLRGASPHGTARYSAAEVIYRMPDEWWPEAFPRDPNQTGKQYYVFGNSPTQRNFNSATPWSRAEREYKNLFASWDHHFNDLWSVKVSYNYADNSDDSLYGEIGTRFWVPQVDRASYVVGRNRSNNKVHALDVHVKGGFEWQGRPQRFVVGGNYYDITRLNYAGYPNTGQGGNDMLIFGCERYIAAQDRWAFSSTFSQLCTRPGMSSSISIEEWNRTGGAMPLPTGAALYGSQSILASPIAYRTRGRDTGVYFSTHLQPMEGVHVIAGARWARELRKAPIMECYGSHWVANCGQEAAGLRMNREPTKSGLLPYLGLIAELTEDINLYASHTTSYERNDTQLMYSAAWNPPYKWQTREIGFKGGFFDNRLNVAGAYFKSKQKNFPYSNPFERTDHWGTGYVVNGFELTVAGQITPRWMISAGFVKQKQTIPTLPVRSSMADRVDFTESYRAPEKTFKLFTTYAATDNLIVGGGVRWQSATNSQWNSPTGRGEHVQLLRQGGFTVVDLMARYRVGKNLSVQLNINNVFDKAYYQHQMSYISGAPRNFLLTGSYRF